MDIIVIRLDGSESLALMKAIKFRLDYLASQSRTPEVTEEVISLGSILKQADPQISQMAAKPWTDKKHQQN
jgi:hypothetical protein